MSELPNEVRRTEEEEKEKEEKDGFVGPNRSQIGTIKINLIKLYM